MDEGCDRSGLREEGGSHCTIWRETIPNVVTQCVQLLLVRSASILCFGSESSSA